jgi:LysM repeat protein
MNAQKQRKNTAAAVAIIVLILLAVLGIGLFFLFNKPAAPVVVAPVPAPVTEPVQPEPVKVDTPAAPKVLGVHTVVKKDTLWWISDKWYKDPVLWPSIYEINKAEIRDPDLIFPGQKFDIPAMTGTSANLSADDKSLLAQGYLEAYRVYKEKGRKDAEDYKKVGDRLNKK